MTSRAEEFTEASGEHKMQLFALYQAYKKQQTEELRAARKAAYKLIKGRK